MCQFAGEGDHGGSPLRVTGKPSLFLVVLCRCGPVPIRSRPPAVPFRCDLVELSPRHLPIWAAICPPFGVATYI